ncbi:uncharacterized protein LOC110709322 [Chenopodium quinoa]|uniref:uncharacterized protein LOC110709322 n=1 Tax=Chenopodium quinoa TaxID=63459 RepID=UPI000B775FA5|nr:uncharacterized protein LOC110709322 [Chenopodium quinoa]
MIKKNKVENLKGRLGFENSLEVASRGKSGGLCLYWKEKIDFRLVSFSQNHIYGDITTSEGNWRFVGVYGWPKEEDKHRLWNLIRHLCFETSLPILFGGDFNEFLFYGEIEGGADRNRREVANFRDMVNDCRLRELGYTGSWYTLERGSSVNTWVRERLDRFLASSSSHRLLPNAIVDRASRSIQEAWDKSEGRTTTERLVAIAQGLGAWSKEKFRKLDEEIDETEKALLVAQHKSNEDIIEDVLTKKFNSLFSSSSPPENDIKETLENVNHCIIADISRELLRPFTKDEIAAALKQMQPCTLRTTPRDAEGHFILSEENSAPTKSGFDSICDLIVSWKKLGPKTIQRGMFLTWCIWGVRNSKVFQNKSSPNTVIVERVNSYFSNNLEAKYLIYSVDIMTSNSQTRLYLDLSKVESLDGINYKRWSQRMLIAFEQVEIDYVLFRDAPKPIEQTNTMIEIPSTPAPGNKESSSSQRITTVITNESEIKKFDRDNKFIRGHLLNSMKNNIFDLYVNMKSAKEMWESLEKKYGADDAGKKSM